MKRKFVLLPITLTALSPMVSMVSCGNPQTGKDTISIEGLKTQYDCAILGNRETNPIKIYSGEGDNKVDITDKANVIIDNDNFVYDTSKHCITWAKNVGGSFNIHIMAYYQGKCSDLFSTKINIVCDGNLIVHLNAGSEVAITDGESGSFSVDITYNPSGTAEQIDVGSEAIVVLNPSLTGMWWDSTNKKVCWGPYVVFTGSITLDVKVYFGDLSSYDGTELVKKV